MTKVVLATLGSLGDLHPFVALATRLKRLGCEPLIASIPDYAERVTAAGIAFCGVGPTIAELLQAAGMERTAFAEHVLGDAHFLFRRVVFPHVRASYADLLPVIDAAALVLTSSLAFAARLAAERLGRRRLAVVLQPMMFLSAFDPPRLHELPWLAPLLVALGPRITGVAFRQLKRLLALQAAPLYGLRRELGLPETQTDPLFEGQFSPTGNIGLYSSLFAAAQPDYPPSTTIAGFAFYDADTVTGPAGERALRDFLNAGPPPLVFTLGSFATDAAGDFFEVSRAVARRLGRRAVLLVGAHAGLARPEADLMLCDYAPYSMLFPCAEAIVHHGGIGTTAQALRAGTPQLIIPHFADQLDNAARARRLGVARTLARSRYRLGRVRGELTALLNEPRYRAHARAFSEALSREDGAQTAAQLVMQRL